MNRKLLNSITVVVLCLALLFSFSAPNQAKAQRPFGGPITFIRYCVNGTWVILGPPVRGSFMWTPGTLSYQEGPPSHSGQYLLGMSGGSVPCLVPCEAGLCPIGYGEMIFFHGSS